jgi:hypothetical protein
MTDVRGSFDLDAALAEREVRPPFEFTFGGGQFTISAEPDVRALAALTGGRLDDALRLLLGEQQYVAIQQVDALLDVAGLQLLLERYAEYAGLDLGE